MNPSSLLSSSILPLLSLSLAACGNTAKENLDAQSNAPGVVFYAGTGEDCCGEDPHPVHGTEAPDGSYVLCGKSIDEEGYWEGFVMKIGPDLPSGTVFLESDGDTRYTWSQTFGNTGRQDAANGVAATDNAVFVVGIEASEDGTIHRSFRKYSLSTGELIWSQLYPSSDSDLDSGLESIILTSDGGAIVSGFVNGDPGAVEGFKSYGNPVSGNAVAMFFSAEQLSGTAAPDTPIWEKEYENSLSAKSIRSTPNGGYVFTAMHDEMAGIVVGLDAQGEESWRTAIPEHGETTDIAVLYKDGQHTGFAVSGHASIDEGIDGSITKLNTNGDLEWTQHYGNPTGGEHEFAGLGAGNPELIYDECWGIQSNEQGGAVIACGTGIEGCDPYEPGTALHSECISDPRTKWRALLIEVDEDGTVLWNRTDSYRWEEDESEGAASASEYVIRTADGNYASVIDQDFGIGLMVIDGSAQGQ